MDYESTFIKPTLLIYYNKGHTELETYRDISLKYGPLTITLKTTRKWFARFRANTQRSNIYKNTKQPKFSDDFLIDLINKNPMLNMKELGELCDTTSKTISNRLKQINESGIRVNYTKKYYLNESLKDQNRTRMFNDDYLIKLVDENPGLSMKKLGDLAGCSTTTIARRIEQINLDGEKVGYCKKSFVNYKTKFSDEYLINLINDNPTLNMRQLARLSNSSPTTISSRIKQINKFEERVNYVKKHYLNENLKSFAKQLKFTDEFIIELVNNNTELNISELAKLANSSTSTISARIRQINSFEPRINYVKKLPQIQPKIDDEELITLINKNPDLNMRELGELLGVNQRTISRRLKHLNKDGNVVNYVKKKVKLVGIDISDDELIELIASKPELNIGELAKLVNCPKSRLTAKIRQLNSREVIYISKKHLGKSRPRMSDKELLSLKESNPELSVRELAAIAEYSASTVYRRLKLINSIGEEEKKFIALDYNLKTNY